MRNAYAKYVLRTLLYQRTLGFAEAIILCHGQETPLRVPEGRLRCEKDPNKHAAAPITKRTGANKAERVAWLGCVRTEYEARK